MATPSLLELAADGSTLALRYSEALSSILPSASRFLVVVNGVRRTITGSATLSADGTTIRLTLSAPLLASDSVSVSYVNVNGLDRTGFGDIRSATTSDKAAFFRNSSATNLTGAPLTLTIGSEKSALKAGETALLTFSFSRNPGASFISNDIVVSGGSLSGFVGSGTTYTAIFTPTNNSETTATISVASDQWNDIFGNAGTAASASPLTIDTKNPTLTLDILDLTLNDADNSSAVSFTFSENVSGFDSSDITVSGGILSAFSGSGSSYTATFTANDGLEANGSLTVVAGSYTDLAGNAGGGDSDTVAIDTKNPTLTLDILDLTLNDADNSSAVSFTFSENVSGFDSSDITVSGGVLSAFSGSGSSYTATFTANDGLEATGSLTVVTGSYTDLAGNSGGGDSDTVAIDTKNPTVSISLATQPLTGQTPSTTVNFNFSETVNGFTASDISVSGGTLSGFSGSGSSYSATYTAINFQSATGTISVGNDYFDAVNNQGVANSSNVSFTVGGGPDPNDQTNGGAAVVGTGTGGADTIIGSTGNNTINAGAGNDTVFGGSGNDNISGEAGLDTLYGGSDNDTITGGPGNDIIYGGSGADTIDGVGADDTIAGGFGNDTLTGGNGTDRFYFFSIYDQQDTITDFVAGGGDNANVIVFDTVGPSAFTSLGSGLATTYSTASANGFFTYSGNILSYDADGSAGTTFAPIPIVTLTGTPTLNNARVLFQDI
jgi:Ca2+-binding RTX toxin-like protein